MRTAIVTAETEADALELCPWAAVITEVDNGSDPNPAWRCFESVEDARVYQMQV
jgi:hypothetical protein